MELHFITIYYTWSHYMKDSLITKYGSTYHNRFIQWKFVINTVVFFQCVLVQTLVSFDFRVCSKFVRVCLGFWIFFSNSGFVQTLAPFDFRVSSELIGVCWFGLIWFRLFFVLHMYCEILTCVNISCVILSCYFFPYYVRICYSNIKSCAR